MPFEPDDLRLIAATREVRIETRLPDGPAHSAIIWIVVDGADVFVRSWLGDRARWYREARADPDVTLVAGRSEDRCDRLLRPTPNLRRCSDGFLTKYRKSKSAQSMVAEDILDTTFRLEPSQG